MFYLLLIYNLIRRKQQKSRLSNCLRNGLQFPLNHIIDKNIDYLAVKMGWMLVSNKRQNFFFFCQPKSLWKHPTFSAKIRDFLLIKWLIEVFLKNLMFYGFFIISDYFIFFFFKPSYEHSPIKTWGKSVKGVMIALLFLTLSPWNFVTFNN